MSVSKIREEFQKKMLSRDKTGCAKLVLESLESGALSVVELYEGVLGPSLSSISGNNEEQEIRIWDEHMRSGTVRMAIELSYPYIVKKDTVHSDSPRAMIFCIEEEYHELGARMTTDFLTLLGFDSYFIGANTPSEEAVDAVLELKPALVCISVSNFYNLVKVQEAIDALKELVSSGKSDKFAVVVGGYAVANTEGAKEHVKPDYFANSYSDLEKIKEAVL